MLLASEERREVTQAKCNPLQIKLFNDPYATTTFFQAKEPAGGVILNQYSIERTPEIYSGRFVQIQNKTCPLADQLNVCTKKVTNLAKIMGKPQTFSTSRAPSVTVSYPF